MLKVKSNFSSEEAIEDILRFVEDDVSDDEIDLDSLFGDDGIEMEIEKIDNNSNDSDSVVEPSRNRKHRLKSLTYQRLANSIDSALQEDNFELFDLQENRTTITGELPDPSSKKKGAKKKITFTNQPRNIVGRQNVMNVIPDKPGVATCAKSIDTPKKAFDCFFPPEFIDSVVTYTNRKFEETITKCGDILNDTDKYTHVRAVDSIDITAVFGLMYF